MQVLKTLGIQLCCPPVAEELGTSTDTEGSSGTPAH